MASLIAFEADRTLTGTPPVTVRSDRGEPNWGRQKTAVVLANRAAARAQLTCEPVGSTAWPNRYPRQSRLPLCRKPLFFSPRTRLCLICKPGGCPVVRVPLLNAQASLARLAPKRGAPVIVSSQANFNIASVVGALRSCHPERCRQPRTCRPSHATRAHHGPSGL